VLWQDEVIFFGDLNYRIDQLPDEQVSEMIKAGDIAGLTRYDQLLRESAGQPVSCWCMRPQAASV
jgi:hypothetical protein